MKRNSFFLVIILLLSMVFISCSAEPASSYDSEVAKVGVSVSKALTSSTTTTTLPDIDDLYVFYTAYKISGGFRTGETTKITPIRTDNDGKGLPIVVGQTGATFNENGVVPQSDTWFSTGSWVFSFYASTTPNYKASNVIFRADDVVVEITRPEEESQNIGGTAVIQLVVDENNDPRENASVFVDNIYVDFGSSFDSSATYKMSVYLDDVTTTAIATIEGTNDTTVDGRVTFTSNGAVKSFSETEGTSHKFDFKVTKGEDPMVFAEGNITVPTAKGQVTTITGDLASLDSLAMIAINLDESVDVVNGTVTNVKEINNITSGDIVVTSDIAPDMTKESNKTTVTFNSEDLDSSYSYSLEVEVTTAAIGQNSEAFEVFEIAVENNNQSEVVTQASVAEIDLTLVKTTTSNNTTIAVENVTSFPSNVHVETYIEPNLSSVNVFYKDSDGQLHNVSEYGDVTYNSATGYVSFYTKHFSKYIVSTNTSELCIMNEFTGKKYKSLQFALSEATDGARFILLGDMSLTEPVTITNDVNLNLNGFDITATDSRAIWVKSGELTITGRGTISSNKSGNGDFASSSSVIRVGSSESQDGSAGLVIDKNVTISSNHCYGVTVFGKNTEGQTLDVKGTVSVTGEVSAISGNGSNELTNTEITIRVGAEVSSTGDVAIYHPQEGTLNIEGGVITGKGGVEVKGGTVTISGGTITATATEASHVANNNGPSTTGYAVVAVENNGYKGDATIEITGGTFTGAIGVLEDSPSDDFDATLSISGGFFSVDPTTYVLPSYSVIHDEETDMYEVTTDPSRNTPLTLEAFSDTVTITIKNAPESLTRTYVNAEGYTEAYDEATATYTISLPVGGKLELRANGTGSTGYEHFLNISGSADFYCYGNVMSLVDPVNYRKLTEIPHDYEFYGLFAKGLSIYRDRLSSVGYNYLVTHPEHKLLLPATTLSAHCYDSMFAGCGKMERVPELPATTLKEGCYKYMFYTCYKLTEAPVLPATTMVDSCYYGMFYNSFLKTAPELPATILADHCYEYMFYYCSFEKAPVLPATTLAPYCYANMFYYCSLKEAPMKLPATTLADHCYEYMFYHCGSLQTAPELPATTLAPYCYHEMFGYCYKLANAPVLPAEVMAPYCYSGMFYQCEALTSAPALPAMTLAEGCYSSMFSRCKKLATAPALPATTLAPHCYSYMFYRCTSLTATPVLHAETLVDNCYYYMFADCSNLKTVTCLALRNVREDSDGNWTTPSWLENVSSSGTIYINPNAIVILYGSDDYWNQAKRAAATWIKDAFLDDWYIPKNWTINTYTH